MIDDCKKSRETRGSQVSAVTKQGFIEEQAYLGSDARRPLPGRLRLTRGS